VVEEGGSLRTGRVGVWLVGARGSVATTVVLGAAALAMGLCRPVGMVTETGPLARLPLPRTRDLIFGGHDLSREPSLSKKACILAEEGVVPCALPGAVADKVEEVESRIRPGVDPHGDQRSPMELVDRVREDLLAFRSDMGLSTVVVINLASTEPPPDPHPAHSDPDLLARALGDGYPVLPASSLYAYAALEAGFPFVDFTPSAGIALPALDALARKRGVPYAGRDGKTGETLVKSALGPMFAARNLRVRSWSGVNLLGGGDGAALADPERARSKLRTKSALPEEVLGYKTESPVHIEYVRDMGEWKTAWDHISFEGFLGIRMRMQFIWEGCDSALAAPLVLDLARLVAHAHRRGESGVLDGLAFFFKDPLGASEHRLEHQYQLLCRWAAGSDGA